MKQRTREAKAEYNTGAENQEITSEAQPHKYFSLLPNMVDDSDLDPYERTLYNHYVRVGECWENVETTALKTHMSTGKVSEARRVLEERGWIRVGVSQYGTKLVTIIDRWAENIAKYSRSETPSPHETQDSPGETKKTHIKEDTHTQTPETETQRLECWNELQKEFPLQLNALQWDDFDKLWRTFPDKRRHEYALARVKQANPKKFSFYKQDFAGYDPDKPKTWGDGAPAKTPHAPPFQKPHNATYLRERRD